MTLLFFRATPQQLAAADSALRLLSVRYTRMAPTHLGTSEAAEQNRTSFARACAEKGVDLDAMPEAAHAWCAREKFPPAPVEFAELAREITLALRARRSGTLPTSAHTARVADPREILPDRDFGNIDRLYHVAATRIGEAGYTGSVSRAVGQCWALLYGAQECDEQRADVRNGVLSSAVWVATGDAWIAGARPTPHPLNNMAAAS